MSTRTRTVSTHARAHRPYSTASPTRPLVFTRARRLRIETAGQAAALTGADPNQREPALPVPFTKLKQPEQVHLSPEGNRIATGGPGPARMLRRACWSEGTRNTPKGPLLNRKKLLGLTAAATIAAGAVTGLTSSAGAAP